VGALKLTYYQRERALEKSSFFVVGDVEKSALEEKKGLDYYSFGSALPGRSFNSGDYDYGFNNQLKDDEIKGNGNSYTTFFRQYDPRLGRWLSLDPVVKPWESGYASFLNNPVYFDDPFGNDPPKRLKLGARIKNWVKGNGHVNRANKYASKNGIEESQIKTNKDGSVTIDESYYSTHGSGKGDDGMYSSTAVLHEQYSKYSSNRKRFSTWFKKKNLNVKVSAKITYGGQLGIEVRVLGLKGGLYGNIGSETWLSASAEQKGHDENPWDVNFNYLHKDGKNEISEGFSAGVGVFGGAYEKIYEYKLPTKNGRGVLTEISTSKTINASVANYTKTVHHKTSQVSNDVRGDLGFKFAAALGLDVNISYGWNDE
jgi:RHS repeat-associated protein